MVFFCVYIFTLYTTNTHTHTHTTHTRTHTHTVTNTDTDTDTHNTHERARTHTHRCRLFSLSSLLVLHIEVHTAQRVHLDADPQFSSGFCSGFMG